MTGKSWRLSAYAARDLNRLAKTSVRTFGVSQTVRYLGRIERRFEFLARNPGLGTAREEVRPGVRSFPEGSHIIYYRPLDGGVRILRVRHKRMDSRQLIVPD